MTHKICTQCKQLKILSDFSPNKRMKFGVQSACKVCLAIRKKKYYKEHHQKHLKRQAKWRKEHPGNYRKYILKYLYGISYEEYQDMLQSQNGKCAICGTTNPGKTGGGSAFHVDHSKITKKVRALLCTRCNQGIGFFLENPDVLREAANYLEKHR
jgi:Recombination endonuclease VII